MEYKILTSEIHYSGLMKEVNEHIKNGWNLQGGVSVTVTQGNCKFFAQAVYKVNR